MVNKNLSLFFFLLLSSFFYSEAQSVPAVFVLGDSQVDVGNNNHLPISVAKANFPHNGVDFPTKKATGRFSNGHNAADFLAEKLGIPTSPPYLALKDQKNASYEAGVSFASGGAGILNSTDQTFGQAIPLTQQVTHFITVSGALTTTLGAAEGKHHISKSLFAVIIGSNDLFDYYGSSDLQKEHTPQEFVGILLSTLKEQIKRVYSYGGRRFLFTGIGVIGCIPAKRVNNETKDCHQGTNDGAVLYNKGLVSMLKGLKSELSGISYTYFDTYSLMNKVIQNPSAYGFSEVKSACCGLGELKAKVPCLPIAHYCSNRTNHVFWDLYHPTSRTAGIFVDAFYDGSEHTYPVNVRQLVSAPLLFVLWCFSD